MKILKVLKQYHKKILITLLAVLIIMQFFGIDKTNPPSDANQDFMTLTSPPSDISQLLKDACYDCHSNHTKYPWYTNIAPVSWWIKGHIDHGRGNLNFSEWGTYSDKKRTHKIEEVIEFVEDKRMPLLSYIIGHPEAKISKEDRANIVTWFKTL